MDAYWAKDIQELFRLERRTAFQRLVELLLAQSGGIFDATHFARLCEISPPTVASYLGVLLNELLAALQGEPVHYWRDKAGHEVDFVLARRGRPPLAIECKWSAAEVSVENLRAFRYQYPEGENVVVAQDAERPFVRALGGIRVGVESLRGLIRRLGRKPLGRGRRGGRAAAGRSERR